MAQIFVPYGTHRIGVRSIEWDDGLEFIKRIKISVPRGEDALPTSVSIVRGDLIRFIKAAKHTFTTLALVDGAASFRPLVVDEIDGVEYLKFECDGIKRQDFLPTPVA